MDFNSLHHVEVHRALAQAGVRLRGNVLDVGGRDSRKVALLKELGADSVFLVEPDRNAVKKAVTSGNVPVERCFECRVEELPLTAHGFFDSAVVFTACIGTNLTDFFTAVRRVIRPEGKLIYSIAEDELAPHYDRAVVEAGFRIYTRVNLQSLWFNGTEFLPIGIPSHDYPDKNIRVASS